MPPKSNDQIEAEKQRERQAFQLESLTKTADKTADVLDALKREYDKDIAALKAEVATLKQLFYGSLLLAVGALLTAVITIATRK